jgi:hypothetical protein
MDLPVSGWYPDPYGTPNLLRWWDGSGWTQHTHPDVAAAGNGAGGTPSATTVLGAVDATALQGAAVADALQATTFQAPVGSTTVQPAAGQPSTGQPSTEWLRQTKPPTGPRTSPQPAIPGAPGIGLGGAYQQTAALGSTGGYQPTMVQPGYPQPGMGWGPGGGAAAGPQGVGYGQNAWQQPGATGGYPGGPGNPYGYQQAQQQRRRRRNILIGVGVAVVVVVIVIAANSVGGASGNTPAASGSTTPTSSAAAAPSAAAKTAAPASASASAAATATASASASPTATTDGSLVTDSQSMLSYSQLPAPWQVTAACPLNSQVFPWTDGEDAPAGTVNTQSGPVNWTGEACSGVLPQSYGYTSTADLQNAAESVAETLQSSYYNALSPTGVSTENDAPLQVSGHAAWEVTFDVQYGNAQSMGSSITDEQAAVVVVDAGSGVSPAVFFASIPNTPTLNEGNITTLVQSLQLNASAAAGAPTATTPPAAGGNNQ